MNEGARAASTEPAALSSRLVASPACMPRVGLEQLLDIYAELGFQKIEVFGEWAASTVAPAMDDLDAARSLLAQSRLQVSSYHLPVLIEDDAASFDAVRDAAHLAAELGAGIVIFKAASLELYREYAVRLLDSISDTDLTVVIQNHQGEPIATPQDVRQVFADVDDERLGGLVDVGHLVRVGASWADGLDTVGDRLRLVHVNDIDRSGRSVPFGGGEVDFVALFARLDRMDYAGNVVVELELEGNDEETQPTISGLRDSLSLLSAVVS